MSDRPWSRTCCALALLGALGTAIGQTTPPTPATTEPAPYQDRVIEGLKPDTGDTQGSDAYNPDGWPRYLRFETRLGTRPFDNLQRTEGSFSLYGALDTLNHGSLSLDGTYAPRSRTSSLTLRQRGMPFAGGWTANHELGVLNSPAPSLAHLPSRITLPSSIVRGVSAEWEQPAGGLSLLAATGEPGRLESLPASGFQAQGGRRSTLGAQWHLGGQTDSTKAGTLPGWSFALLHEAASGMDNDTDTSTPPGTDRASASYAALRHETDDTRIQGQLVASSATADSGRSQGFWVDGEWDNGPRTQGLGLYRLDPGLHWAQRPLASDVQGFYYRQTWRTRQFSAEGSLDWLRTVSRRAGQGVYGTASARWRLDRDNTVGGGFSARRFDGNAWSTYADWRWRNPFGPSGFRLELSGGELNPATRTLSYDQEWPVPLNWTLNTSLGVGSRGAYAPTEQPAETFWSAAVALSVPVSSTASVRGNLSTEQGSAGQRRHNLNLGAQWRLTPHWSLDSQYTRALGQNRSPRPIDPLAPDTNLVDTTSDRSFYAALRYEAQAGSRLAPLGGKPQQGGGRIDGTVFFDHNRSGTQDASETGAPGVTVTLDNRYAVRTDAQGRFSFPFVAAGPRTISVRNDTLPLPWGVVDDGQIKIDVRLRETTALSLPVQRAD